MTDSEINREVRELEGQGAEPDGAGPESERYDALLAEKQERTELRSRRFPEQRAEWRPVLSESG